MYLSYTLFEAYLIKIIHLFQMAPVCLVNDFVGSVRVSLFIYLRCPSDLGRIFWLFYDNLIANQLICLLVTSFTCQNANVGRIDELADSNEPAIIIKDNRLETQDVT